MCCRGAFKCSAQSTSFRAGERSLSTRGHLDRRPQMIAPELDSKECLPQDAGAKNPSWQTMCRRHRREEYVKDLPQTIPTSTKSCSLLMHAFLAAAWPSCVDARPITPGQRDSALKTCKQTQENVPKHYCSTVWCAGALQLSLALVEMAVCVRLGASSENFLTKHPWVTMVHCSIKRSFETVF